MRLALAIAVLLLAGCAQELTPEQREAQDEAAIAAVEAAQIVPPEPVTPEPILFADIEANDLFGAGCSFVPDSGVAERPVALAKHDAGYIKVEGEVIRLAPDSGSGDLPLGARGRYDGRAHSFLLDIGKEEGTQSGMETVDYPAEFILFNERDQLVYNARGIAQCGS